MKFYILESGSKGNCTIVESNGNYLMIDNGLSGRKLTTKLKEINIEKEDIGALLVTHGHSDHIAGISVISRDITYTSQGVGLDIPVTNWLIPMQEYDINGFHITCIPTSHDAPGSIGFIINDGDEELVYITDTGFIYEVVIDKIMNADYYIIESNHDVRMLLETKRTQQLKNRILGDTGHLSNVDSANYMCDVIGKKTKQIILAHLSEEANTPEKALEEYRRVFAERDYVYEEYDIRCASQQDTVIGGNN